MAAQIAENTESYTGVYKSNFSTHATRTFKDIEANRSVRPSFDRSDYDAFRENSAVPQDKRGAIRDCMKAYKNVGIIRNVIDLMGDFACQGVAVVHRDKSAESFYKQWFKKINGKERSERFLNNLYRSGNVVAYRSYADVTPELKTYMKSLANDVKFEIPEATKNRIPFRYNFFNPLSLDIKDGDLHLNVSNQAKVHGTYNSFHSSFKTSYIPKKVFETLPTDLRKSINNNEMQIPLDADKLIIAHYKKDDWEDWADPLVTAILDDIIMLEKMRLADMSALDGAISNIRLWTLGDLEHKILPNKAAIDRLRDVLATNQGGGTMELVWGPELSFTESATEVHKFLGSEKYNSVLNAIYAGMGVPPTLTGMAGNGGGFTNNFISLKTLVERLQYGRDLLVQFWEKEVEIVRKAMGFRYAPEIVFDQMSLSDEAAEKALLIQLADRDIISHETLLERFKETAQVEKVRLQREVDARDTSEMPNKAGPFHNPENDVEIDKMEKQSELDIKRDKAKPKDKGGLDKIGRPKNKKDSSPRKKKVVKPRSKPGVAEVIVWTDDAWDKISSTMNEAFLGAYNKTTLRQLTKAQTVELELLKVDVLASLEPLEEFNQTDMINSVNTHSQEALAFRKLLKEKGISMANMSVDTYRKNVIGLYSEYISQE